jgi:hypothetical protein
MRRASTCLAVLGLSVIALAVPSFAAATPVVTFKARAVPVPALTGKGTIKGTGNILGAGAALQAEYTITGTEYGGAPPPLEGINFYLPAGAILHESGFPTCPKSELEPLGGGPEHCPKGSAAGPVGKVVGFVEIGKKIVEEDSTVESFYAPGGGLEFYTYGHEPTVLEIISTGKYVAAHGLYSHELVANIPLIEPLPETRDASVKSISVKVGSAYKSGGKTIYYGKLPKKCPKGGFPLKTEMLFAGVGGLSPQVVSKTYKAPCPSKK